MSAPIVNLREVQFQLFEALDVEALTQRERFSDHSRETFAAALDNAFQIATERFANHARKNDEQEPQFDGERVRLIPEIKQAAAAYIEAGWLVARRDYDEGGMQLPATVGHACSAMFSAANVGTNSYLSLTSANGNVIEKFGTEAQKRRYLPGLRSGRFFGTMAMTEPQAGSSLADIRTSATPNDDGSYSISGSKIFISAGDHDLSDNIVHLVLARIAGAPAGIRGISLFIVPKFRVDDDGRPGAHNDVHLAGLLHKMGWRGTTSTLLAFGEQGECRGELVGEPHRGLVCMFHMMNEARIGVGTTAVMLGYRGYQDSLEYARLRPQGRALAAKGGGTPQIPIIGHSDVRRMLLAQKAYVEGGLGLCLFAARLVDEQNTGPSPESRADAGLLLELLTPVVKSWPAQWCLEANSLAIQVHGGYGYTREYPVEQWYRDNRLNLIHEGTHGIQALDLLGRKLQMNDGEALRHFAARVHESIAEARDAPALAGLGNALERALADTLDCLDSVRPRLADAPERVLSNAVAALEAFGHVVVAWIWLRQAIAAQGALDRGPGPDSAFYLGKLQAARWFFRMELPKTALWYDSVRQLDDTSLSMQPEWF